MRSSFLSVIILFTVFTACKKDQFIQPYNNMVFLNSLSAYSMYEGEMKNLKPTSDYLLYELGSTLFTDFAHKQRLIYIPIGLVINKINDGLPNYPEGTIIAKTFYYVNDERDETSGKHIIETRILIKKNNSWNVADYLWNDAQTDAFLIESGFNTPVHFINESGEPQTIAYHVPNNRECATCHNVSNQVIPIGPTLRNLNIPIHQDGSTINQLSYFQSLGILESFDVNNTSALPDFHDMNNDIAERARGYLDINCAHCHFKDGAAADTELYFNYEDTENESLIRERKDKIQEYLETGVMPRVGTSVIDQEGVSLIIDYLNQL